MKTIITNEGKKLFRVSRWIRIRQNYNPNRRNSLWYYVTDESGYIEGQDKFNPQNGLYLDYFKFGGRTYAINQFFRLSFPMFFENEEGKTTYLSGYDSENYYNPLLIEISDCGEYIRLYEEARN